MAETYSNLMVILIFYILSSDLVLLWCRGYFSLWIYTQSVGLLGRVIGPSQGLYINTGQHKNRITHTHTHQTSMPEVGFDPTITASTRARAVHAFERSATVIGR
jgi:hypothetical protein